MRVFRSLTLLQFLTLQAVLCLVPVVALAQDGGAGGGGPLQGGVRELDATDIGGRQTMRLNINTPASGFFDNGQTLQGGAHTEHVGPEIYRGWLTDNQQKFALTAQTLSSALVVDVAGHWDHADKTLDKFGINYTHIKTGDITPEILAGAKVMIINCAGEVKRDRLQFIRDFVQRGGYLLTTDWALNNMLEQTFPGYVYWNKDLNQRSIYTATFVGPDPVLAKGCVRSAPWKLDAGAHLIGIQRHDLVRVLVTSPDMAAESHDHTGVLACLFPFGRGYVLHMVGHFDNNNPIVFGNLLPDPAPKIKISLRQALAVNFIIAGLTGEPIPSGRMPQSPQQGGQFASPPQGMIPQRPFRQMPAQPMPQQYAPVQQTPQQYTPVQPMTQQNAPVQQAPQQYTPVQPMPQQYAPVQQAPQQYTPVQPMTQQYAPVQQAPQINTAPGEMPPVAPDRLHRVPQQ